LKNIISHLKPCDSNLSGSIAMRNNPYRISEVTAQLISKISISTDEQNKIAHNEAIPLLLNLITSKYDFYPKIQEAALEALSCLCKENKDICLEVIDSPIGNFFYYYFLIVIIFLYIIKYLFIIKYKNKIRI